MTGKLKRVISLVLVLAMALTMGPLGNFGREVVKASDSVRLYFELPDGTAAADWVVNAWSDVTVDGDAEHAYRPTPWGNGASFPALRSDENRTGWGYVTVSGAVQGLQFVNAEGKEYNCWNSQIAKLDLAEAYYSPADGVWYKEAAKENEVKEAEVLNIFVLAGSDILTGKSWSIAVDGNSANVLQQDGDTYSVTYTGVPAGTYEYKILQDPDNKGWNLPWGDGGNRSVTVDKKSDVTFTIDINDGDKKVDVTMTPLEEETGALEDPHYYIYNVYYYDSNEAHMDTAAADLWAWEDGGANFGPIAFEELVELSDGNHWLKATFEHTATAFGLIPRSKGTWNWQTGNHMFVNEEGNAETDLYIVYGDDAHTYTSLPTVKETRKRTVLIEYVRPGNDYEGWNIYSWNTGLAGETEIYAQNIEGKQVIAVPVKDSEFDFDMQFCMRRSESGNMWAEKDGGDHAVTVPGNQTVVKAVFEQGRGITAVLPYNRGYEMDGKNHTVHFYYRDDARMAAGNQKELSGKVFVVVNQESFPMSYDAAAERFVYDFDLTSVSGAGAEQKISYYYMVDGEKRLDAYNAVTEENASVISYKTFGNMEITAAMSAATMDYEANNVLTVALKGAGADAVSAEEIDSITADLSELGLGLRTINKELMATTVAVTTDTTVGTKHIPITLKDVYGNVYTTEAVVEVTGEDDASFDWDEAIIYFAVTDRFFDGSKSNNSGVDKSGSLSYHGGDFAGLTEKLDYLKELGVNTIWITPIVANSDTTTEKDGQTIESTGYHGYWASDFTTLNPHLGTEREFEALIREAHERDMKLMVDVVLNHSGYQDANTGFDPYEYFNTILVNDKTGERLPMLRDADNTVSGDDVYSSLAGLPDFVTEDARVREQLIAWQVDWMEKYDIDYFRVDTVKHVQPEAWQDFKNALTKANPDFKMIGEYSGAGYASAQLGIGAMDSLLDFDFNDQAQSFVTGNITGVESFMAGRNAGIDNTRTVGAFLSSHDEDGLAYKLVNQNHMTEQDALDAFKVAAALELTAKGQVVVYYGEELGLYGADNYPYQTNRYDFDWAKAEAQEDDANSMLNHYRKLLAIRNSYLELFARGGRTVVEASDADGYDVFKRTFGGERVYVALNIRNAGNTVTFAVDENAGTVLSDLYGGQSYEVSKDKTVTVKIPASANGGTVVLAAKKKADGQGGNSGNGTTGNGTAGNGIAGNTPVNDAAALSTGKEADAAATAVDAATDSLDIWTFEAGTAEWQNKAEAAAALDAVTGDRTAGALGAATGNRVAETLGAAAEDEAAEEEGATDSLTEAPAEAVTEATAGKAQTASDIADDETPLAATGGSQKPLPVVPIAAGAGTATVAAVCIGFWVFRKRKL